MRYTKMLPAVLLVAVLGGTVTMSRLAASAKPSIRITIIPPYDPKGGSDSSAHIQGQVSDVKDFSQFRVVIYSRTNQWYVQPEVGNEFTSINNSGIWEADVHTGSRYGALLVTKDGFHPHAQLSVLPKEGSDSHILASTEAEGTHPK